MLSTFRFNYKSPVLVQDRRWCLLSCFCEFEDQKIKLTNLRLSKILNWCNFYIRKSKHHEFGIIFTYAIPKSSWTSTNYLDNREIFILYTAPPLKYCYRSHADQSIMIKVWLWPTSFFAWISCWGSVARQSLLIISQQAGRWRRPASPVFSDYLSAQSGRGEVGGVDSQYLMSHWCQTGVRMV